MILDSLSNSAQYSALGARVARAFDFLRQTDVASMSPGRHSVDGDDVYALVLEINTKSREQGVWEAHRRYLDIQAPLSGDEVMGYAPTESLAITQAYDAEKDFYLMSGDGSWLRVGVGMFALFLPQDGHMVGVMADAPRPLRKVVMKVLI